MKIKGLSADDFRAVATALDSHKPFTEFEVDLIFKLFFDDTILIDAPICEYIERFKCCLN